MVDVVEECIAQRFQIETRAATGGMGTVYQAQDLTTGARVAVKLLHTADREGRARFAREAEILAGLTHPAIVRYIAHGTTDDGTPYLAMDWVEGETLAARLERAALTIDDAVTAARRVADALGHAHARGIVHRDVKPTNLILPRGELTEIAMLDFGIARADAVGGSLTATGAMVGTPSYMAPEQARGERDVGPTADVFSLGCVLYECVTGRRAFEGTHVMALLAKVALWDPPRPLELDPNLAPALDALIARMLAKLPTNRPRDGAEVAQLLGELPPDPRKARARLVRARTPSTQMSRPNAPQRLASIVVAADPAAADSEQEPAPRPHINFDAITPPGVRIETMRDGSIVAVIGAPVAASELAQRALVCARALRSVLPDDVIAIATGEIAPVGDPVTLAVGMLVDQAIAALAREAMSMVFAGITAPGRPDRAIRLDERTAKLVDPTVVTKVGTAWYVGET